MALAPARRCRRHGRRHAPEQVLPQDFAGNAAHRGGPPASESPRIAAQAGQSAHARPVATHPTHDSGPQISKLWSSGTGSPMLTRSPLQLTSLRDPTNTMNGREMSARFLPGLRLRADRVVFCVGTERTCLPMSARSVAAPGVRYFVPGKSPRRRYRSPDLEPAAILSLCSVMPRIR